MKKKQAQSETMPRFVIFEGVDGVGKTTAARTLTEYYRSLIPKVAVFSESFPGSRPGTLGEWVYRLHHAHTDVALRPSAIDPVALQLLHVAAHVDIIRTQIAPILADPNGGAVILDRYWWSTYAYTRPYLSVEQSLAIVESERIFWRAMRNPIAIYLTRETTLKPEELERSRQNEIETYYQEILDIERREGMDIQTIANDGTFDEVWAALLSYLRKK